MPAAQAAAVEVVPVAAHAQVGADPWEEAVMLEVACVCLRRLLVGVQLAAQPRDRRVHRGDGQTKLLWI